MVLDLQPPAAKNVTASSVFARLQLKMCFYHPHLESAAVSLVVIVVRRVGVAQSPHGRPRRRLHQAAVAPRDGHLRARQTDENSTSLTSIAANSYVVGTYHGVQQNVMCTKCKC